jgi:hypothetical protein
MKNRKNTSYVLVLLLAVVSGLVFTNCETQNETKPKPLSVADRKTHMVDEKKKWEASPDGIKFKAWQVSDEGKKVRASYDKINKHIKAFTAMEAVVTSVTFQRAAAKSPQPKWLIVSIDGEQYMMQFSPKDFKQLSSLEVNDKIIVKSRSAGCSPSHPYLIVSGDYIAHNNKVLFKRDFSKNKGC